MLRSKKPVRFVYKHCLTCCTRIPLLFFAMIVVACSNSGDNEFLPPPTNAPALFHFRLRGHPVNEDFRAYVSDPDLKIRARNELKLPENQRSLHAVGTIAHTNGGFNLDWNWHFKNSVNLAVASIELCDTSPSLIASNVEALVNAPSGACPWASYIYAEIP